MKISLSQLPAHLKSPLLRLYVLVGSDEVLQEAAEKSIYLAAQSLHPIERVKMVLDQSLCPDTLRKMVLNRSLFASWQYCLLNAYPQKIPEVLQSTLTDILPQLPKDHLWVIKAGKWEGSLAKSRWYQVAEKVGAIVSIWPLSPAQVTAWTAQKFKEAGLHISAQECQLLCTRTQYHLADILQTLEKLKIVSRGGYVSEEAITNHLVCQTPLELYHLHEVILQRIPQKIIQVVYTLAQAGIQPPLALWLLRRDALQYLKWHTRFLENTASEWLFADHPAPRKKQQLIIALLGQHTRQSLHHCVSQCTHVDRIIKGASTGQVWDALCALALALSGKPLRMHLPQQLDA